MIDGPRVPPASGGPAKQLVIFAHGYGSNGDDLIGLAGYLARFLPDAAFASPNAPQPLPGYPGGAYQWFGLANMDMTIIAEGARAAAPALDAFIDAELKRHGLGAADCALVGFSQGTMMALHVGLRRAEPLGAVVGFSGLLAGAETLATELRSRPPILLAHGDRDDRVPIRALFETTHALAAAQTPAMWRITPGSGHTIPEDALQLAGVFLHDAFAGRFTGWTGPTGRG
ncbi:MAG: alpha/beta hydrolase [Caulobacteraceae bacterium]